MNPSITSKSILASLLNSIGIVSMRLRRYCSYNFVLLMYHRVLPMKEAYGVQAGMYVLPETFENHLKFLKKYFEIVPISSIVSAKNINRKPYCILTFDDGWHDFFEYAFPILKAYQVPATVFLPTDFIGTSKRFWTDRLTILLLQRQRAEGRVERAKCRDQSRESKKQREQDKERLRSGNGIIDKIENLKGSFETRLEKAIQILKPYRDERIEEILSELSRRWGTNPDPQERAFLSWEEAREMAKSGLITFGSHTAGHRILTTLTDVEIQEELKRSKENLISEDVLDKSFIPFCYPNGNYNEKIAGMVRDAGYTLAVTTDNGWNSFGCNPFTLKRMGIHQDICSTEAMLGCRIVGIL